MPTDEYYERLYASEDKSRMDEIARIKNQFKEMTDKEKIDFLVDRYIEKEVRKY